MGHNPVGNFGISNQPAVIVWWNHSSPVVHAQVAVVELPKTPEDDLRSATAALGRQTS